MLPFDFRKALYFLRLILLLCVAQPSYADKLITFPDACAKGESIIIAAVGDVLLHTPLRLKGAKRGYETLWQAAVPYFHSADIVYANLEGPMAPGVSEPGYKNRIYTGFPYFNYPPALASALKNTGVDIVSTANNHAFDRDAIGIDKTIESLDEVGLAYTGTRARGSDRPWVYILNKKNFRIAWISCTEHTNGHADTYKQILYCYKKKDRQFIINTIKTLKSQVDAIIVAPHWGDEYSHRPNDDQIIFAHQVLNAGATAVLGSHPHVLQPLQKYITKDGRTTLIMYSLGNFVSNQSEPEKRSTVILLLGLTRTENGTVINGVRFVPMLMQNNHGLDSLQLNRVTQEDDNLSPSTIANVMPMGNVLYADPVITNPQCYSSQGAL